MADWHFKPQDPGGTIRDPILGEFFATDAISDPGMALIREGIQNSLDARSDDEPIRVRVFVSGDRDAAASSAVLPYFRGARSHLEARGNGIHPDDLPNWTAPCPFLVFEDFGTQGLEGDVAQPFRPQTAAANHFYHFFRAEGQTDKGSSQRGSWGVGKHVFWRSSRLSTVFALTVRASDTRRLLMGKSVLKCHYVGDRYCQDGYYGVLTRDGGALVMPVVDPSVIEHFRSVFRLRRDAEPGLSVVVPWPDVDITPESLVRAVVHDYFQPILKGELQVVIESPSTEIRLQKDSLLPEVKRIGGALAQELEPILELADWTRSVPEGEKRTLHIPDPARGLAWGREIFPEGLASDLQSRFERLERIAVRVPVTVRKKGEGPRESFFEVFLVRDPSESSGRPTFIREGVIVPKVDAPRSRGVRALVLADDGPLASFLRDAENPSHTEWQHDSSNFRGKYVSGRTDLTFVKRSVREIVRLLSETETKEDRTLLADFFSLPLQDGIRSPAPKPTDEEGSESPFPPGPRPAAVPFRVQKVHGGFSVLPGGGSSPPRLFEVLAAYDVRRGNPLRRYRKSDFILSAPPIKLEPPPRGLKIVGYKDNGVLVEVLSPEFSLHLVGFDRYRDLYVRVEPREDLLASPTA
jgi:hypothetical protein